MPAMLDDPTSPAIYRTSGAAPFPTALEALPPEIIPRQVTLRDRVTIATLVPFSSPAQVPPRLTAQLCDTLNREIEKGDTYPMTNQFELNAFASYWFANFAAIMIMGDIQSPHEVAEMEKNGTDWSKQCLGSFYIKPNYPGRSSHVCNGGFLVTDAARNRGVGRLMGEGYLDWAPKLGYLYSVFNLVYETNVASLRIWDALGFKRIGRVKGCGNLKSHPDEYVDAIIYGRELGGDEDEYISEERFDKIRYYLKFGTYPPGSDRAEKSRLRSAATHYRLEPAEDGETEGKLMLKGKEVISDPHKQYEIARNVHLEKHWGINKTTATIADKYHWVRIKETVSAAIKNCSECKDTTAPKPLNNKRPFPVESLNTAGAASISGAQQPPSDTMEASITHINEQPDFSTASLQSPDDHRMPIAPMHYSNYTDMPVDPQIMSGIHWDSPSSIQNLTGHPGTEHMQVDGVIGDMQLGEQHGKTESEHDGHARLEQELHAQMLGHHHGGS